MSTENATLADFDTQRQTTRERPQFEEARYGKTDIEPEREPPDAGECRTCGREVPEGIQRVTGDNHGRVVACPDCFVQTGGRTVKRWSVATTLARDDPEWPERWEGNDA